eukprot:scaffold420_cov169-Ochromonas_danica.AAC.29
MGRTTTTATKQSFLLVCVGENEVKKMKLTAKYYFPRKTRSPAATAVSPVLMAFAKSHNDREETTKTFD